MKHAESQKMRTHRTKDGEKIKDQEEFVSGEVSTTQEADGTKKALSKREIMEQLSRERFPWDE